MEAQLENPVIKPSDLDQAEAELLEASQKFDAEHSDESPSEVEESAQPEARVPENEEPAAPKEGEQPDNSEIPPEKDGKPKRGPDGQFIKTDEPAKPTEKPETEFTKAQKEKARKDRSWAALEAEKEQARAQIAAEQQAIAQAKAHLHQQMNAPRNAQYSTQDYVKAGHEFKANAQKALEEGDTAEAAKQNAMAEKAFGAAQEVHVWETQTRQASAREDFSQRWKYGMEQTIASEPDEATKAALVDPASPLAQAVSAVLQREQIFGVITDGFSKAVEVAKLQLKAGRVSELEDKLKKAEAEVTELRRKTGIKGSGPTERSGPKSFDDMTPDEQMAHVERQAAQYDAAA